MNRPLLLLFLLALPGVASAETLWASAPVDGARWPDAPTPVSVHLIVGDEVEVLVRKGPLVRVRKGADFGWVSESMLTSVPPAPPAVDSEPPVLPELPPTP